MSPESLPGPFEPGEVAIRRLELEDEIRVQQSGLKRRGQWAGWLVALAVIVGIGTGSSGLPMVAALLAMAAIPGVRYRWKAREIAALREELRALPNGDGTDAA